jgi:hypothetical protein
MSSNQRQTSDRPSSPTASSPSGFQLRPFTDEEDSLHLPPLQRQGESDRPISSASEIVRESPSGFNFSQISIYANDVTSPPQISQVQRQMVQRWVEPDTATQVTAVISTANTAELRRILAALEVCTESDHIGIEMPSLGQSIAVAVADATELRTQTLNRLIQHLMEDLSSSRRPIASRMNAATDDASRRTEMNTLHTNDAPILAELRRLTAGQKNRWQHPDATVQDDVLAAIQLDAVFNAEADLAAPAGAHTAAANAVGMDESFDWCGFFAANQYMRSSLDRDLRQGFFHVDNVEDYFTYHYASGPHARVKKWIYAEGAWHELQTYHSARGSVRHWTDARAIHGGGTLDIRSGDIVLIDHSGSARPDHIVMVQSWDAATQTLFTIGGNDGGYEVDTNPAHPAPKGESADARERRLRAEAATGAALRPGHGGGHVGVTVQDLSSQPDPTAVEKNSATRTRARIFGIGRPSIVDFEDHIYDSTNLSASPTVTPSSGR